MLQLFKNLKLPANQNLSKTVCCEAKSYFFFTCSLCQLIKIFQNSLLWSKILLLIYLPLTFCTGLQAYPSIHDHIRLF